MWEGQVDSLGALVAIVDQYESSEGIDVFVAEYISRVQISGEIDEIFERVMWTMIENESRKDTLTAIWPGKASHVTESAEWIIHGREVPATT